MRAARRRRPPFSPRRSAATPAETEGAQLATPNRTHALPGTFADLLPRRFGLREALDAREASIVAVLVVMAAALSIAYPQFRTLDNVNNSLLAVAQVAIVGVGM